MPTHPITGARYPTTGSSPNGPQQIQDAVSDLSVQAAPRYATSAARDSAFATWTSAGNTMDAGMMAFTKSDGRYWRWSASASAWVYAGGNPPPISAVTLQGGWTALSGHQPGVYKDSSGLVHLAGAVVNTLTYTPNVGANVCQLPSGFYNTNVLTTGLITLGDGSGAAISFKVTTGGMLAVNGSADGSVAAGSGHWLESASPWHVTYAGVVPLA